jgi:outer membrane protein assembly factor BamD (BamD/ComL family)
MSRRDEIRGLKPDQDPRPNGLGLRLLFAALGLALLVSAPRGFAASAVERHAFEAAARDFNTGFYARADTNFGSFVQTFTNSARLPEAILFQAKARMNTTNSDGATNYDGAIQLLTANLPQAGGWADQFIYWEGQAGFGKGDFAGARDAYARVVRDYPASSLRLQAAVSAAAASGKLDQWRGVVELLQQPGGAFQSAIGTNLVDEWVQRGFLLLGEAQLALKDFPAAESALDKPSGLWVNHTLNWQGQYLRCRIDAKAGRLEKALSESTNLWQVAGQAGQPAALQAESAAFQARILEGLGRSDEAIRAYTNNLAETVPAEFQREALLKITSLLLAQGKVGDAAERIGKADDAAGHIQEFLARFRNAAAADLAWLTLGQLRFQQYEILSTNRPMAGTNTLSATNSLQQAIEAFIRLTNDFPQSPLKGEAQLDLGCCYWQQAQISGNRPAFQALIPKSEMTFQTAVDLLPAGSSNQGVALFNLAAAEFQQSNYSGAVSNYRRLTENFGAHPEAIGTNLCERALYEIVRAGAAGGDVAAMTNALQKLLAWYPDGFHTDRAVLLAGQGMGEQGDPAAAREILRSFVDTVTNAPLLPEVHLAIARTFEEENRWDDAVREYEAIGRFTGSAVQPRAAYYGGLANFFAGHETNAFICFTNLIARFPTNEEARLAQWWTGDFYYRNRDYTNAESAYESLSVTWPSSELGYRALMMAGNAAFARQAFTQARDYFTNLCLAPSNCPIGMELRSWTDLRVQAWFALGDTYMSMGDATQNPTNAWANYGEAIGAFSYICQYYPTNPLAVLAQGERANCFLQTADYTNALAAYRQVTNSPAADVSARSQAMVGMAIVLEKQAQHLGAATDQGALFTQALDYCLDVFHASHLREGEKPDLFWTKKAGLEAAHLAETLNQGPQAIGLYDELEALLPFMRDSLENKKSLVAKKLAADKGEAAKQ